MFTILLAWINAKYKSDYEGLFIVTTIFDILLIYIIAMQKWM